VKFSEEVVASIRKRSVFGVLDSGLDTRIVHILKCITVCQ